MADAVTRLCNIASIGGLYLVLSIPVVTFRTWKTVNLVASIGLGACGGALVSLLAFSADLLQWRKARRVARASRRRRLPTLTMFVDPLADLTVALVIRVPLGALAGGLFHAQLLGVQAAIAVGAAAPALLSQFGRAASLGEAHDKPGTESQITASIQMAEVKVPSPEED